MLNRGNVYAALAALSLAGYPFIAATSAVLGVGSTVPSIAMRSLIIVFEFNFDFLENTSLQR